jgi:hypothetical protein
LKQTRQADLNIQLSLLSDSFTISTVPAFDLHPSKQQPYFFVIDRRNEATPNQARWLVYIIWPPTWWPGFADKDTRYLLLRLVKMAYRCRLLPEPTPSG